jgi:hypothetical protein
MKKTFVYDYYLFTTRRGSPPNHWAWEIRRKSDPEDRTLSAGGFRSAKAAEEAGKAILAQIREGVVQERLQNPPPEKPPRKPNKTYQKRGPIPAEQRSENARKAAHARAAALSPERRKEIGRLGGAAWKEMWKRTRRLKPDAESGGDDLEFGPKRRV